jgi:16S rRNA (guanine527-N7)-methyltransferase
VSTTREGVDAAQIGEAASSAGLALEAASQARLAEFAELFLTWNARINLGGAISARELVPRHFVDSFVASRFVPPNSQVLDVGSGGGLPAIPLALARADLRLHLFEPTGKKVAFLRAAVRELQLKERVEVHAERIAPERVVPGRAGVAMSRATWAPTEWLALGRTLVAPTGTVLVFGTGGDGDPREDPREEWRYGPGRRLLVYDQTPVDRST